MAITGTARRWWMVFAAAALVVVVAVVVAVLVADGDDETASPPATGTSAPTAGATGTSAPTPTTTTAATTTSPGTTSSSPTATVTTRPTAAPTGSPPTGIPPALRGQDLTVVPTSRRVVALTFDAGANSAGLPSILATLADQGVQASFFLTGRWAAENPARVASISAAGHRVGNHSMTHPAFTGLTDAALRQELQSAEQAIRAAGADPRPLFRFPLGDRDARTIAAVNDAGYVPVRWTVDTLGWQGTSSGRSARSVTERAMAGLQPGEIVLMHIGSNPDDGSTLDADALPDMITRMRAAGYDFVTLDALFG